MTDALDFPALLEIHEAETAADCVPVAPPRAPFRPGQRIYDPRHPSAGSVEVVACERYPGGGWLVEAMADNCRVVSPAEHYRACPEGWTEPPFPPDLGEHFYLGVGGSLTAWAREQAEQIPEYQERVSQWQEMHAQWLRWLNEAERAR